MSICNNSSTFSNSLYTYLQCWSSNTMLLFKLNSADLSVADSYQYVFPINYSDLRSFCDKLKLSDSSGEILITIGNDQNISSFNFMLLKHDFNSISNPLAKKEIDPGSLPIGKSSRFKRYFDYDNSKGYLICAFSSKLLFFTIDLDTISLQKGFYYFNQADTNTSAADINMNSSNGYIYISFIYSSQSYIYTFDPCLNVFLDTYVTTVGDLVYGIAANGDILYLSISISSGTSLAIKTFNMKASSDPDSAHQITKILLTLSISSDFSLIDSPNSIVGSSYIPSTTTNPVLSPFINSRVTLVSYNSISVCNETVVVPAPKPTSTCTSSNKNSLDSPTTATQTMSYTMAGILPITMSFNVATMMTAGRSFQNFWSLINEYQLYETLVIMGVYIPDQLVQFWITFLPSIFSFSFMEKFIPNPMVVLDSFKSDQKNDAYSKIGIKYQSLLANKIFFLINIGLILIADILITPILIYCKRKYLGWRKKFAEWLLKVFHFKIYIRSMIECFLFTYICGLDEINQYFSNYIESGQNLISFIIASIWMLLMNIFMVFVCWHYFKTSWKINDEPRDNFTSEIYLEVKQTKRGRSYTLVFFVRRLAISTLVVLSVGRVNFITIICLFSLIQLLAIIYSILCRPLANASINFIEVMNNFIFWMVSTSLAYFDSKEKWFNSATYGIMGLLAMSSTIVCLISFANCVKGIITYFKNKNKVQNQETSGNFKNKTNNRSNSIISQTGFKKNPQTDKSNMKINFERPRLFSSEIISNHMHEEVKIEMKNQELIRQNNYNDLSRIQSEILSIIK